MEWTAILLASQSWIIFAWLISLGLEARGFDLFYTHISHA